MRPVLTLSSWIAIVLLVSCATPPEERSDPADVAIPAAPVGLRPAGPVQPPFTFEWRGSPSAVYHFVVFDEAQRLLYENDVRGTSSPSPRDLDVMFAKGGAFAWQVTLMDPAGRAVKSSQLNFFRITP